jgi:hypothetical protein
MDKSSGSIPTTPRVNYGELGSWSKGKVHATNLDISRAKINRLDSSRPHHTRSKPPEGKITAERITFTRSKRRARDGNFHGGHPAG